jgi:TPR repeat protein
LAAEHDNPSALSNLGFMYDHGLGVEIDDAKALVYYSKAAKKGDPYAIKNRDIIEARLAAQHPNK